MSQDTFKYSLRRTLPPFSFEENLRELGECLEKWRIDEVIVKIDPEDFYHGHPLVEEARADRDRLFKAKELIVGAGAGFSLNPWVTLSHNDGGRDSIKRLPGLQTAVGINGEVARTVACSLSPVWRKNISEVWGIYAETEPDYIWIEDDIRQFGHRPVGFACFCDLHIQRFSSLIGQDVSREELAAAIMAPGEPHPWRKIYLDMQSEIMIDTVDMLAEAVDKVSPETCLALMTSNPRCHCAEGRDWERFTSTITRGRQLVVRPGMGSYNETSLQKLQYSQDSIKIVRSCVPENSVYLTEVENFPFTSYSKSSTFTFLQMAISAAMGCEGATLNIFDHRGTPMMEEKHYGEMMAREKDFLDALASKALRPGKFRGVRVLHNEKAGYFNHAQGVEYHQNLRNDDDFTPQMLESHGIATVYDEDFPVTAVGGQVLRSFTDEQIEKMLGKGLLLDGFAASVLFERGYGDDIGLKKISESVRVFEDYENGPYAAEEFFNSEFGGAEKEFMTMIIPDLSRQASFRFFEPDPDAIQVSRLVDPDLVVKAPALIVYENSRGGRVAVMGHELRDSFGVAFCSPFRQKMLKNVLSWLSDESLPLTTEGDGAWPLGMRKDSGNETLLSFFNLNLDSYSEVVFTLSDERRVDKIETLTADGRWNNADAVEICEGAKQVKLTCRGEFTYQHPLCLNIVWT